MSDALIADRKIVRLTCDWPVDAERAPKAGDLVRLDDRDLTRAWSSMRNGGWQKPIAELVHETHPPLSWKDFPALLEFYFNGHGTLPNLKPAEDENRALDSIACGAGLGCWPSIAHVMLPGDSCPRWARAFISSTQGGSYDGRGYLIAYQGFNRSAGARLFSFALCAHAPIEGAGANHMRGWHPARCPRCGLDLSVDSGD